MEQKKKRGRPRKSNITAELVDKVYPIGAEFIDTGTKEASEILSFGTWKFVCKVHANRIQGRPEGRLMVRTE